MRVLFAGTPEVALPVLNALLADPDHEVVGVLTRADARRRRGKGLEPSPVAARAREAGLDVRTPTTLRDAATAQWVRSLAADVAVVVAYGRLVPADLLDVPRHGWLNVHFSLLPAWRGAAPVQRAVMAGERLTGVSVFRLEEGLDTGPVYASLAHPIGPEDTSGNLLETLAVQGTGLVRQVLADLDAGTAVAQPQAESGVSLAPALGRDEGEVRWQDPAAVIDCRVRGVTPAPGAWTTLGDQRLRLGPLTPVPEVTDLAPGLVHVTRHEVLVGTGGCAVRLGQVAPAGKKWMAAQDWARGARLAPGTVLGGSLRTGGEQ